MVGLVLIRCDNVFKVFNMGISSKKTERIRDTTKEKKVYEKENCMIPEQLYLNTKNRVLIEQYFYKNINMF